MEAYSRKQEIVNGLIHGVGMLFGVSGLPVLTGIATAHGNIAGIVGSGIYGFCFLLLFTNSTIYHIATEGAIKRLFKINFIVHRFLNKGGMKMPGVNRNQSPF